MMPSNPKFPRRKSIRLQGYDYSSGGMYFITVCTNRRQKLFAKLAGTSVVVAQLGLIVLEEVFTLEKRFPCVVIDSCAIMPDHLHLIIEIDDRLKTTTIGAIVGSLKSRCSRRIRDIYPSVNLWQRNYYERIIRNEQMLQQLREYIFNNPEALASKQVESRDATQTKWSKLYT